MSRPKPDPHPLEVMLAGRLSPATLAVYGRIWRRIDASGTPATTWFNQQLAESGQRAAKDKSRAMAIRTATVLRAATERYVLEIERGDPAILPKLEDINGLSAGDDRKALEEPVLLAFNSAAEREMEPYRTILLLLPLTGLRIHEICELHPERVTPSAITVVGKGNKKRTIPLSVKAATLLTAYQRVNAVVLGGADGDIPRVFGLREFEDGRPRDEPKECTPRDVWRAVMRVRTAHPALQDLAVHQTRHTTATRMLRKGANLKQIQDILGHKSLRTLERYLHSTEEELRDQLDKL